MKLDRPNRCFVIHPHLFTWIESDLESWLGSIETDLQGGRYSPKDCSTCYEPKGNWMVRPGAVLDLTDELVFNALIGSFQSQIWKTIGSAQGDPDIAYQLQKDPTKDEWVQKYGAKDSIDSVHQLRAHAAEAERHLEKARTAVSEAEASLAKVGFDLSDDRSVGLSRRAPGSLKSDLEKRLDKELGHQRTGACQTF
jgi:hypothetical protein